ncbi:hypothetical protein ZIOFF_010294 [Zingiber officinale]|uniref:Uncharacterized protein n=1 Tax=Zingiber officinale TaxID=94328 RepID=A0A8J5I582_ZINOF|nr:hypothetical protein ZIOFF_010294 [Zingiber officinale]
MGSAARADPHSALVSVWKPHATGNLSGPIDCVARSVGGVRCAGGGTTAGGRRRLQSGQQAAQPSSRSDLDRLNLGVFLWRKATFIQALVPAALPRNVQFCDVQLLRNEDCAKCAKFPCKFLIQWKPQARPCNPISGVESAKFRSVILNSRSSDVDAIIDLFYRSVLLNMKSLIFWKMLMNSIRVNEGAYKVLILKILERNAKSLNSGTKTECKLLKLQDAEIEFFRDEDVGFNCAKLRRYEGRCVLPANFDANYCYALGYATRILLHSGKTGRISSVCYLHHLLLRRIDIVPLLSLLDYGCLRFVTSLVTASVVFISRYNIDAKSHPWGVIGKYFDDCNEEHTGNHAKYEELARKFWDLSEKMIKANEQRAFKARG